MSFNVMTIADFAPATAGNFLASINALSKEIKKDGGNFIYIFPQKAKEREWTKKLIESGECVEFYSGNTIDDAKLYKKIIKKNKINVVHTHFEDRKIYIPVRIASLGKKIVRITHVRSNLHKVNKSYVDKIKKVLIGADAFIFVSEPLKNAFEPLNLGKYIVVNNAIDFSRLDTYEELSNDDFNISPEKTKLFSFGYNFNIKGIDIVLNALDKYDKDNQYIFMICPAGKMDVAQNNLIERYGKIPDNIRLLPARNDIATYYHFTDIFVSASRKEGFSYARSEAAYCKRPILLSDIEVHKMGNIPGLHYFKSEDSKELFEELEKIREQVSNNDFSGEEEAKYVTENYSMNIWTKKIIDVYSSLM